ncbi:MAG: PQQ-dependent sugar dehydrogenase [Anaerolineae bacterium]|nr:PQQ-dependent sugar dehydrogenase [Anaerolineae bacterium]NUQ03171.1 PQQ-dependent sugar dehydrogenase [Anaerolineae bacterium]
MSSIKGRIRIVIVLSLLIGAMTGEAPGAAQNAEMLRAAPPVAEMGALDEAAGGFIRPLYLTHAGDGSGRLFVVEQGGKIWILDDGERRAEPFLNISHKISPEAIPATGYTERGLLGLAFHPNFAENGLLFVNYTDISGATVVERYQVSDDDANTADAQSAFQILHISQPYPNHNGGHMAFGPDGYLYSSVGDGGSGGDPEGNGQNLGTLLGTILRIDIDVPAGQAYAVPSDNPFVGRSNARSEIWLYGVRNVWRFSFDRLTGDLYAADVGQNQWEEVNFIPAGQGGFNLGWNIYEAMHPYSGALAPADMMLPIAEYPHSQGISVTGGYVYRGNAIPDWQGVYVYGDFGSGMVWGTYRETPDQWRTVVLMRSGRTISSFGEDEQGELYLIDYSGSIYRIVSG